MYDYVDMKQVVKAHTRFFFSEGALTFFDSILDTEAYRRDDGNTYFVTGERYDPSIDHLWTVRVQHPDGDIDTVGDFQKYGTKDQARLAALEYASA